MKKIEEVDALEIAGDIPILYNGMDAMPGGGNLGRAEFLFCPKYKGGRLVEMFVSRVQQRDPQRHYRITGLNAESFRFTSGQGPRYVAPWRMGFCKKHKTTALEVYVPEQTSKLAVRRSSILVDFDFR